MAVDSDGHVINSSLLIKGIFFIDQPVWIITNPVHATVRETYCFAKIIHELLPVCSMVYYSSG
jgi:hypothetical protein